MVIPVTMKEKRYILAALAFFSTFNVYSIRNGITISIMDMANIVKESQSGQVVNASIVHDITVCPFPNVTHSASQSNNISTGHYKGKRNSTESQMSQPLRNNVERETEGRHSWCVFYRLQLCSGTSGLGWSPFRYDTHSDNWLRYRIVDDVGDALDDRCGFKLDNGIQH